MKNLLQKNDTIINPAPQRIVWLYKRWQPMYDVIKSTVNPPVEFIEGIPAGIDTFFNQTENNLLIIDDLMSSCGDDPQMTEIFYEGSHHRSLSVVLLCQNLYYSKSPTQRRNSHYVVLFKNPNDLQSVMTFARQINPKKTKEFLQIYGKATSKPHGYLLLDFKQATQEKDRLRPNVLDYPPNKQDPAEESPEIISAYEQPSPTHSMDIIHGEHIVTEEERKMVSCDYCGIVMDNIHDLQRHLTLWCPLKSGQDGHAVNVMHQPSNEWSTQAKIINNERIRQNQIYSDGEPRCKKFKTGAKSEYRCFAPMREEISKQWGKVIKNGQKAYEEEGYKNEIAKAKTINENIKEIRKDLREAYANFIKQWMDLNENSAIHQKVMAKTEELHDHDNLNWVDAARLAIKEYKPLINMNALPDDDFGENSDDNEEETDDNESDVQDE